MRTLRTSRKFTGNPISIRALSKLEGRTFPVHVSDILADNEFRGFDGQLSSGDVDCTWHMSIWKNGFWSVTGDFHDGGIIAGDFFSADFVLDNAHSVGANLTGSILDPFEGRHLTVDKSGSDPWIRENWDKFQASGPHVTLQAKVAVGTIVLKVLAVAIVIGTVFFGKNKGDSVTPRPCPDQFQRDAAGDFPSGSPCVDFQLSSGPQQ